MKIDGVIIKDDNTGKFFAFIRQFPFICAQGDSLQETNEKLNKYFKSFSKKLKMASKTFELFKYKDLNLWLKYNETETPQETKEEIQEDGNNNV